MKNIDVTVKRRKATAPLRLSTSVPKTATAKPALSGLARAPVSEDRKGQLLIEAARQFGARGYNNTSMRDIASAFGVLPGSLYHHFGSKEELFIAVYAAGVTQFVSAVERAVAPLEDPWDRLEAGCVAHVTTLLGKDSPAANSTVLFDWSITKSKTFHKALVKERDRYEAVFSALTAAVELPKGVSHKSFHLALLGALTWTLAWYRPGGKDSPATVARNLLAVFRGAAGIDS
jgi:AcrR family transcriptional regulator